jgi:hypothetical protein
MRKRGFGAVLLMILIFLVLVAGFFGYFLFLSEKCSKGELFNPYSEVCVSENILCNLDRDCTLLEGQTASINDLQFTLISATEQQSYDESTINIEGRGEVNLMNRDSENREFSYGNYTIILESADGDADKLMGATFIIVSNG